jgi:polysaccharide pyruvyl transferase WcaK-like protein
MKHFTAIYCREQPSVGRLRAKGVEARLCPDLTFALEVPEGIAWRPGDRIVVLDTTVARTNRALHRFSRASGADFQTIRCSPRLLRTTNPRNLVRIVRFNATKAVGQVLTGAFRFNRYASAVTDRREFLRRISDGTLVVVAGRFHGVCFCMKLGVPFLAVASNTAKIEGMLADAGLSGRQLAIEALDIEDVRRRAPWSEADEANRRRYVADAQATIAAMFDELARAVAASPA